MTKAWNWHGLYPRRCTVCAVPRARVDFADSFTTTGGKRYGPYASSECRECQSKRAVRNGRKSVDSQRRWKAESVKRQTKTAPAATRRGAMWTGREDAIVRDYSLTAVEVALRIERTAYAVQRRRQILAAGERERAASVAAAMRAR